MLKIVKDTIKALWILPPLSEILKGLAEVLENTDLIVYDTLYSLFMTAYIAFFKKG
jgi:hypothetical protein